MITHQDTCQTCQNNIPGNYLCQYLGLPSKSDDKKLSKQPVPIPPKQPVPIHKAKIKTPEVHQLSLAKQPLITKLTSLQLSSKHPISAPKSPPNFHPNLPPAGAPTETLQMKSVNNLTLKEKENKLGTGYDWLWARLYCLIWQHI